MKISKLFHWLYAILMFMPIFAIGVSCLYVIFNKNAKDSYYGETINQINYVYTDYDNLVINDEYLITPIDIGVQSTDMGTSTYRILISNAKLINDNTDISSAYSFSLYSTQSGRTYINIFDSDNQGLYTINSNQSIALQYTLVGKNLQSDSKTLFNLLNNNLIEYNKYSYLDNVFYYSIEQLKNNSLFNWSKDSFLAQPITYITDLFGMDNDNIVIYLLSYWLDISIIWLVFDLVMYVPLVIHRWIDKGVLE